MATPLNLADLFENLINSGPHFREAAVTKNPRVLKSLLGPAYRGLIRQRGKTESATLMPSSHDANFDWEYKRDHPELARLYEAAKKAQWNATTDIDWDRDVDPYNDERPLFPERLIPTRHLPVWKKMSKKEKAEQGLCFLSWLLSQFLHGEQGALFAAAQVTECVPWLDGKLYGSTQVVDEGRHVEVFHSYLDGKLEKRYDINDNLYVVIDALMGDSRWDMKFLGMQIMIEGLALGAFGTFRKVTNEPLLRDLLRYVIGDEARHVHYGVLALTDHYTKEIGGKEQKEREDWAFEISLLLRNRFLAREIYEESYAHALSRAQWDRLLMESEMMGIFRSSMFRRIMPNLKRIGLLSDRIRPYYDDIGLLKYEGGKAAPELSAEDLLDEREGERAPESVDGVRDVVTEHACENTRNLES